MSDGHLTPPKHDGMAAFQVGKELRLVRNHEVTNSDIGKAGSAIAPRAYDPSAGGGTTTLVIDPITRECVRDFVSLSGTLINCAGGPTPWGSWISCEETVRGPLNGFERSHGYCFEVPAVADRPVDAQPLKAMGRFKHEAIAVDPATGVVYLTEDSSRASGFYRFIPRKRGNLASGGQLQMLQVKGTPDVRTGQKPGTSYTASWVDISDPDPPEAEKNEIAVHQQGVAKGGTTFARLEGCLYGNGRIYFDSTTGGDKLLGQVWEYLPLSGDQGRLTLLHESGDPFALNMPDNLCLDKAGKVIICEDNKDSVQKSEVHLRIMNRDGLFGTPLAKNIYPGFEKGEFAGATFSPDFKTLFVNIQDPGLTLAIWGPW